MGRVCALRFKKGPKFNFEILDSPATNDKYPLFNPSRKAELSTRALNELGIKRFKYNSLRKHITKMFSSLHDQLVDQDLSDKSPEPFVGVMLDDSKITLRGLIYNFDHGRDERHESFLDEKVWGGLTSEQLNARKIDGSDRRIYDELHAFAMIRGSRALLDGGGIHYIAKHDRAYSRRKEDIRSQGRAVGDGLLLNASDQIVVNMQRRMEGHHLMGQTGFVHRFLQYPKQLVEGRIFRPAGTADSEYRQKFVSTESIIASNIGVRLIVPLEK